MALEDIFPVILGRCAQVVRSACVMPRLLNSNIASELSVQGATLTIPITASRKATNVVPGPVPPAGNNPAPGFVNVGLDYWMNDSFHLNDQQLSNFGSSSDYLPTEMMTTAGAVADAVNESIFDQYPGVYGAVGVAGTTPFATSLAEGQAAVRQLLLQKAPPTGMKHMVLDPMAYTNAIGLDVLQRVDASGSNITLREAEIGRALGFFWHQDQAVPAHITGAAGTILTAGAQLVGSALLLVDGATTAPKAGDIFTIAGHTQRYAVLAATTLSGTASTLSISPALQVAVPDNAALTFAPSHMVNLAFNAEAFAFASRPAEALRVPGAMLLSYVDEVSGLVLTLEVKREHFRTSFYLSCLWGVKLVDARLATRILG